MVLDESLVNKSTKLYLTRVFAKWNQCILYLEICFPILCLRWASSSHCSNDASLLKTAEDAKLAQKIWAQISGVRTLDVLCHKRQRLSPPFTFKAYRASWLFEPPSLSIPSPNIFLHAFSRVIQLSDMVTTWMVPLLYYPPCGMCTCWRVYYFLVISPPCAYSHGHYVINARWS